MIHFSTTLQQFDSNLWGYHLPVPKSISEKFVKGSDRRVNFTINQTLQLHGALMSYSEGYFLLMNKDQVTKLNLSLGEQVNVEMEKDTSEFGMPMPESFRVLLDHDPEGNLNFEKLTPGRKRSLIYLVAKVKNIDSQLNKGLAILDHLKQENGSLDFKKLNELIKNYNQRARLR